ncbi:MAG: TIGR00266 family protein [Spirochaetaceae bacterium]|jgi:uncharacterized protein (TIGR00266 family)|nr:TIGR00266 family protein [Spirochaetaceae bacterium]
MTYRIEGTPFPALICRLESGESMMCENGAMAWMSETIKMQTTAGNKGLGGMFSRMMTGEGFFQNVYTAEGGAGTIAFRGESLGAMLALDVEPQSIIAQKGAYIASEPTVNIEIALQKPGAGFFGGEGFILQKFSGRGRVFLGIDGSVVEESLRSGETLLLDTGTLGAAESSVTVSVEMVKGLGNLIAGGEGAFHTKVTGPGKIWLQTMPMATYVPVIGRYLKK